MAHNLIIYIKLVILVRNQTSFEILLFLIGALLIALVVIAAIGGVFKSNKSDALLKAANYKKFSCSPPEVYDYPNLLLALHFEDNNTANDSSRFRVVNNSIYTSYNVANYNAYVSGVKKQGLLLNTTALSVNFYNLVYNSSVFSLSFWFNASSVSSNGFLIATDFLSVNITTAKNIFLQLPSSTTTSSYPFTLNTWNNVEIQRDSSGTVYFYYDGDLVDKLANVPFTIQSYFNFGGAGNSIVAVVDEFKYFNILLTSDQVQDDLFCGIRT